MLFRSLAPKPDALKAQVAATAEKLTMVASGPKGPRIPGRDRPPTLAGVNGSFGALYEMIEIDAAPTAAQLAEAGKAERQLTALAAAWDAIKTTDLPALNAALTAAGLTAVRPDIAPETRQTEGDEE